MTLFTVIVFSGLLMCLFLVVDGGAKLRATQRADAVAAEAARQAGQAINEGEAVQGQLITPDTAAARTAAQNYLSSAGVQGTVSTQGTTITVTTTVGYDAVFFPDGTVDGSATARLARTIGGEER